MDSCGGEEIDLKPHWMLAFLIAGALAISTEAQDVNAQSKNTAVTQQGSSDQEHTIVVDVWSKSEPDAQEPVRVSSVFAVVFGDTTMLVCCSQGTCSGSKGRLVFQTAKTRCSNFRMQ